MKGRDALRDLVTGNTAANPAPAVAQAPARRSSGAIRAMSLSLDQMSNEAAAARDLRKAIESGESRIDIDPALIDASPVLDRIPTENDPQYDELKAAIADGGQQVPILVRPHPIEAGRYQVAYGRRRLRAAHELGRTVSAFVRPMTDKELIIAQAQENGPRADLSFIERALFASNLIEHSFDKDTICAALSVGKPELSRLLNVASSITPALIAAIGPAPKIGRPRWQLLAEKCADAKVVKRINAASASDAFRRADTNARFNLVLAATVEKLSVRQSGKVAISTAAGQRVAWLEETKKGVRLSAEAPDFSAFLQKRLPDLLREFESAAEGNGQQGGEK